MSEESYKVWEESVPGSYEFYEPGLPKWFSGKKPPASAGDAEMWV